MRHNVVSLSPKAMSVAGVILAAGKGTRMKSALPKCAFSLCGLPMVEHVARAMRAAGVERPIIVIGHGGEVIQDLLGDQYDYVWQHEQLGTGHAVLQARDRLLSFDGPVLISAGDTPLLESHVLARLVEVLREKNAQAVVATSIVSNPYGYGRIVRGEAGRVIASVEEKDASNEVRKINEVNASIYCMDAKTLFELLPGIGNSNAQGEYYLTDMLGAISSAGGTALAETFEDAGILVGVNDRWQLSTAAKELQLRILRRHAMSGVSIIDPDSTIVEADVQISPDAIIHPSTALHGKTFVGARSSIGPFSRLVGTTVGEDSTVLMSNADGAVLGDGVCIGPYAHLRPRAHLGNGVKIGNFVEVKNAQLLAGSKANHLAYIGDASVGEETNIGAGTITCNYDGFEKHRTEIGANVFIGSNSTLVAPIQIGDGSMIAAGSVINRDVPDDAAAFGRARQETKPEWAAQWRKLKQPKRT